MSLLDVDVVVVGSVASVVSDDGDVVVVPDFGAGAGAPGVSMCPANTEMASARLRIVAALIWRRVFTLVPPREMKKFFINLDEPNFSCKSGGDFVRFARSSFPLHSIKM